MLSSLIPGAAVVRSDGPLRLGLCRFIGLPRIGLSSSLALAMAGEEDPDCVGLAAASLASCGGSSRPPVPLAALVEALPTEAVSGSAE
ncbi:MAG: hypothetical protein IMZ46_00700 [Acidobacteria bacterium]|nr:hypothetical protein [Acidobacteriota bacterium]